MEGKTPCNTLDNVEAEAPVNTLVESLLHVETRHQQRTGLWESRSTGREANVVVDSMTQTLAVLQAEIVPETVAYTLAIRFH